MNQLNQSAADQQSRHALEMERVAYSRELEKILLSFSEEVQQPLSASIQLAQVLETLISDSSNLELMQAMRTLKENMRQLDISTIAHLSRVHDSLIHQYKRISGRQGIM